MTSAPAPVTGAPQDANFTRNATGLARIGRTLAINPGSEYSEGVLRGAIITLSAKKGVRGYQLVAG
jgi:Icc-related predicted phosphoesterase